MSVCELFGHAKSAKVDWPGVVAAQECPFLDRKCIKVRKSSPEISIGTCTVEYGGEDRPVIICPHRLRERARVFVDCLHLLRLHEPGNDLHLVPEISIPGGSVDYFLVSTRNGHVRDFVGIELQTLDTTGTVWPARQRFLRDVGMTVEHPDQKSFGMNWKMTAKTILVQLHHKVTTFEHLSKALVLVVQDRLLEYMRSQFEFQHISGVRAADAMHLHAYGMTKRPSGEYALSLAERVSTTSDGIGRSLGLQASPKVELDIVVQQLSAKMGEKTRLAVINR